MKTNQTVLQEIAEYAEVDFTVTKGKLHFLVDEKWVDVTELSLNEVLELVS